ncbi:unnamed protein product [Taenia asiatica]|uniref:EXOSC1 domain-containing protein n=1 Tax=Taenia asiatica TaxID=60517 RepID=A0A0R3WBQ8_TAEAS|nr:unnamed protein product [Taenia asiatica]
MIRRCVRSLVQVEGLGGTFLGFKDEKTVEGDFTHVHCGKILSTVAGRVNKSSEADSRVRISVLPVRKACPTPDIGSIVIAKVASITRRFARCDLVGIGDRPLAGKFRGMIRREDIRATQRDRADPTLSFRPGDLIRARVINIVGSNSGAYASTCLPEAEACCPEVGAVIAATRAVAGAVQPSPAHGVTGSSAAMTTYLLSTAEEELGVVLGLGRPPLSGTANVLGATSGCPLLPTSWTEMICPRTLVRFPRKVARVPDELLKVLLCNPEEINSSE